MVSVPVLNTFLFRRQNKKKTSSSVREDKVHYSVWSMKETTVKHRVPPLPPCNGDSMIPEFILTYRSELSTYHPSATRSHINPPSDMFNRISPLTSRIDHFSTPRTTDNSDDTQNDHLSFICSLPEDTDILSTQHLNSYHKDISLCDTDSVHDDNKIDPIYTNNKNYRHQIIPIESSHETDSLLPLNCLNINHCPINPDSFHDNDIPDFFPLFRTFMKEKTRVAVDQAFELFDVFKPCSDASDNSIHQIVIEEDQHKSNITESVHSMIDQKKKKNQKNVPLSDPFQLNHTIKRPHHSTYHSIKHYPLSSSSSSSLHPLSSNICHKDHTMSTSSLSYKQQLHSRLKMNHESDDDSDINYTEIKNTISYITHSFGTWMYHNILNVPNLIQPSNDALHQSQIKTHSHYKTHQEIPLSSDNNTYQQIVPQSCYSLSIPSINQINEITSVTKTQQVDPPLQINSAPEKKNKHFQTTTRPSQTFKNHPSSFHSIQPSIPILEQRSPIDQHYPSPMTSSTTLMKQEFQHVFWAEKEIKPIKEKMPLPSPWQRLWNILDSQTIVELKNRHRNKIQRIGHSVITRQKWNESLPDISTSFWRYAAYSHIELTLFSIENVPYISQIVIESGDLRFAMPFNCRFLRLPYVGDHQIITLWFNSAVGQSQRSSHDPLIGLDELSNDWIGTPDKDDLTLHDNSTETLPYHKEYVLHADNNSNEDDTTEEQLQYIVDYKIHPKSTTFLHAPIGHYTPQNDYRTYFRFDIPIKCIRYEDHCAIEDSALIDPKGAFYECNTDHRPEDNFQLLRQATAESSREPILKFRCKLYQQGPAYLITTGDTGHPHLLQLSPIEQTMPHLKRKLVYVSHIQDPLDHLIGELLNQNHQYLMKHVGVDGIYRLCSGKYCIHHLELDVMKCFICPQKFPNFEWASYPHITGTSYAEGFETPVVFTEDFYQPLVDFLLQTKYNQSWIAAEKQATDDDVCNVSDMTAIANFPMIDISHTDCMLPYDAQINPDNVKRLYHHGVAIQKNIYLQSLSIDQQSSSSLSIKHQENLIPPILRLKENESPIPVTFYWTAKTCHLPVIVPVEFVRQKNKGQLPYYLRPFEKESYLNYELSSSYHIPHPLSRNNSIHTDRTESSHYPSNQTSYRGLSNQWNQTDLVSTHLYKTQQDKVQKSTKNESYPFIQLSHSTHTPSSHQEKNSNQINETVLKRFHNSNDTQYNIQTPSQDQSNALNPKSHQTDKDYSSSTINDPKKKGLRTCDSTELVLSTNTPIHTDQSILVKSTSSNTLIPDCLNSIKRRNVINPTGINSTIIKPTDANTKKQVSKTTTKQSTPFIPRLAIGPTQSDIPFNKKKMMMMMRDLSSVNTISKRSNGTSRTDISFTLTNDHEDVIHDLGQPTLYHLTDNIHSTYTMQQSLQSEQLSSSDSIDSLNYSETTIPSSNHMSENQPNKGVFHQKFHIGTEGEKIGTKKNQINQHHIIQSETHPCTPKSTGLMNHSDTQHPYDHNGRYNETNLLNSSNNKQLKHMIPALSQLPIHASDSDLKQHNGKLEMMMSMETQSNKSNMSLEDFTDTQSTLSIGSEDDITPEKKQEYSRCKLIEEQQINNIIYSRLTGEPLGFKTTLVSPLGEVILPDEPPMPSIEILEKMEKDQRFRLKTIRTKMLSQQMLEHHQMEWFRSPTYSKIVSSLKENQLER